MADDDAPPPRQDGPPGGGRRIMGLPPRTALIVAGVGLVGGLGYLWWRSRQAASQSASTTAPSTGCTDSAGNSVPCPDSSGVDQSGELSVIQTELETLASEEGNEDTGTGTTTPGTGTTTTTVTVPKVTGMGAAQAAAAIKAAGLVPGPQASKSGVVTSQTPGPGARVAKGSTVDIAVTPPKETGGKPPTSGQPPVKGGSAPAQPSGLQITDAGGTGFKAEWKRVTGASTYQFRITYQDKLVHSGTTPATSATVSGLQPDHSYTFHVKACNKNGCSAETNGPVGKTTR